MRILSIRERPVAISRLRTGIAAAEPLTTSLVAVLTDVVQHGRRLVGLGFGSFGRHAQSGLIRERFAPRLMQAPRCALVHEDSVLDPFRAWTLMMQGEKPGGHGDRCVAIGAIDMALWDVASKAAGLPLYRFMSRRLGRPARERPPIAVYASGGYVYPDDDLTRLDAEMRGFADLGFTHAKIKIGAASLTQDLHRFDVAARAFGGARQVAADAMNAYGSQLAKRAATALARVGPWWFEDVCDPLDFPLQAEIASSYRFPIAAGEGLVSLAEAKLLDLFGGLRKSRDILLFDPVHCYGVPGYVQIVEHLTGTGWPRSAFWPHGGHLFSLHVAAALGLGGTELNPFSFAPLNGLPGGFALKAGKVAPPDLPGIGIEACDAMRQVFQSQLDLE